MYSAPPAYTPAHHLLSAFILPTETSVSSTCFLSQAAEKQINAAFRCISEWPTLFCPQQRVTQAGGVNKSRTTSGCVILSIGLCRRVGGPCVCVRERVRVLALIKHLLYPQQVPLSVRLALSGPTGVTCVCVCMYACMCFV